MRSSRDIGELIVTLRFVFQRGGVRGRVEGVRGAEQRGCFCGGGAGWAAAVREELLRGVARGGRHDGGRGGGVPPPP